MESDKNKKFFQKLKETFKESILSSNFHGIANVVKSSSFLLKLMWIIFIMISASFCVYMIVVNILSYLQYEVSTKTRLINEYESIFPTVTICNINFFTTNLATKSIEEFKQDFSDYDPLSEFFKIECISKLRLIKNEQEIKDLGDSKKKLIFSCFFNGEDCDYDKLSYFRHPSYGNCYQFNSGYDTNRKRIALKKISLSERTYSLRLALNVSIDNGLKFMNGNLGALLLIHNQSTYPTTVDEITIGPKTETNIGLSRTFFESQPKPFSSCDGNTNDKNSFDSEFFKLVHEKNEGYSQKLCVFQCYQKEYLNRCKCYVDYYPSFYNGTNCGNNLDCVNEAYDKIDYNKCLEKCPLECQGMWFDYTISTNKFFNPSFEQSLKSYYANNDSDSNKTFFNSKELAVVNIYYKDLKYVSMTEIPTLSLIGLFSNIGGIGGLFLGASLLTFLEIIAFLIQVILLLKNEKN